MKHELDLAYDCYKKAGEEEFKEVLMKIEAIKLHEKTEVKLFKLIKQFEIKPVFYEMDDN